CVCLPLLARDRMRARAAASERGTGKVPARGVPALFGRQPTAPPPGIDPRILHQARATVQRNRRGCNRLEDAHVPGSLPFFPEGSRLAALPRDQSRFNSLTCPLLTRPIDRPR